MKLFKIWAYPAKKIMEAVKAIEWDTPDIAWDQIEENCNSIIAIIEEPRTPSQPDPRSRGSAIHIDLEKPEPWSQESVSS